MLLRTISSGARSTHGVYMRMPRQNLCSRKDRRQPGEAAFQHHHFQTRMPCEHAFDDQAGQLRLKCLRLRDISSM